MTDNSRKTPPLEAASRSGRLQSQDERDLEGLAARKERESASSVPVESFDDVTGKYEGEELEQLRSRRPTVDRIKRLENKHDETRSDLKEVRSEVKELSGHVSNLREDVAGAVSKLEGQEKLFTSQEKLLTETLSIVKKSAEREHVTFTAKVEVDKAQELAKVEVDKDTALAQVKVDKEKNLDVIEAKRLKRKTIAKVVGGVASGGALIDLLHRLGIL